MWLVSHFANVSHTPLLRLLLLFGLRFCIFRGEHRGRDFLKHNYWLKYCWCCSLVSQVLISDDAKKRGLLMCIYSMRSPWSEIGEFEPEFDIIGDCLSTSDVLSSSHLSWLLRLAFMKKLPTVLRSSPSCCEIVTCISFDGLFVSLKMACRVLRWRSVNTSRGFFGAGCCFTACCVVCCSSFLLQAVQRKRMREEGQNEAEKNTHSCLWDPEAYWEEWNGNIDRLLVSVLITVLLSFLVATDLTTHIHMYSNEWNSYPSELEAQSNAANDHSSLHQHFSLP